MGLSNVATALGYTTCSDILEDNHVAALRIIGNTCYLNALLDVLARVNTLRHWFQQHLTRWGELG